MKRLPATFLLVWVLLPAPLLAEIADSQREATVLFNAVNKISGRTTPLEIPAGAFSSYDKLQIYPAKCIKMMKGDEPVYASLLEVYETSLSKTPIKLFSGWLFSDSHSLTNIENQYYDLVLESCTLPEETAAKQEEGSEPNSETTRDGLPPVPAPENDQDTDDATPLD